MNIKDTIKELGLENETLPKILNQRVNTVVTLQDKIELAEKEVEDDPTEENKANLQEIKDYYAEYFDDIKGQLVAFKKKLDAKKKSEEEEEKEEEKEEEEEKVHIAEVVDEKDKKGSGIGAILIGVALLGFTFGAVNILRKK